MLAYVENSGQIHSKALYIAYYNYLIRYIHGFKENLYKVGRVYSCLNQINEREISLAQRGAIAAKKNWKR